MAIPAYSTRFYVARDTTAGPSGLGPSSGQVWVLRDVQVFNGNTLTFALDFSVYDVGTAAQLVVNQWTPGESGPFQWQGRIVIPFPESINFLATSVGGSAGVDVYLGGYVLAAV